MAKLNKKFNYNKYKKILLFVLPIFLISILIINFITYKISGKNYITIATRNILSNVGIYTEEIKSVEIESSGYSSNTPSAWHIDKSAEWTSTNTAQIKFDVNSIIKTGENKKDVILVLDISGSMGGEKLEKLKSDSEELISYLLSDEENTAALITFDTNSEILSKFTNDKDSLIEKIQGLTETGYTNYDAGLKNVLTVLDDYEEQSSRDLVILFLTDGYPNEDNPNQVSTYEIIKDKYSKVQISGIQYEMGMDIIDDVKAVSDVQFLADMDALNNVLFEASIAPEFYENFEVVDYVDDDFKVNSVDDIKVSQGTIKLEEENGLQKITWNLGDSFRTGGNATMTIDVEQADKYTNTAGLYPTNDKEVITSKLENEDEKTIESTKTPVLKNEYKVIYDVNTPTGCSLDSIDSETHFIYETVKKKDDTLSCNGYLFKAWEIADDDVAKINDDYFTMPQHDVTIRATWTKQNIEKSVDGTVNEKSTLYKVVQKEAESGSNLASLYTGNGSDSYAHNVYYYRGAVTNNNVLFANFCWKIVRTTETGGVKLIYNGVPSDTGTCDNTGTSSQLSSTSKFNSSYNSPAYVGYMYNKAYTSSSKPMTSTSSNSTSNLPIYRLSMTNSYNYYFAKDYTISGTTYTLTSPEQLGKWSTIYSKMADNGYYTCKSTSSTGTCETLYYVVGGARSYAYTIALTGGKSIDDVNTTMTFGSSYIDNGDGTYTLDGTISTIKKSDWYTDYAAYKGKYVCSDLTSVTCSTMYYTSATSNYNYTYENLANNYKYANDVEYDTTTGTYKLIDTDVSSIKQFYDYSSNYGLLGNNHYTCFNITGECSSVYYIYYSNSTSYYMTLTGGTKIEDALDEMLYADNVNTKDSTIKTEIDTWYAANMTDYTDYLEDTVFCNDRSISSLGGWNPSGGSLTEYLYFSQSNTTNRLDLTCKNENDKFTVSEDNGNGKLTYPVGLLNTNEVYLAYKDDSYSTYYLNTDSDYWLSSPNNFNTFGAISLYFFSSGSLSNREVYYSYGVRPSVSLRQGTVYSDGDGSVDNPYIVVLEE